MQSPESTPELRIFYDGGCKVCAWEVKKYLAIDHHGRLGLIDIDEPGFDAAKYGLDRVSVKKYFHVLTREGRVIAGVDAFIEIWKTLGTPLSRVAARVAQWTPIHLMLRGGYRGFVIVRPYLPRNTPPEMACEGDRCSLKESKKE